MIKITLPDGSVREYHEPLSAYGIANSIAVSLAKKAIAVKYNDSLHPLDAIIDQDLSLEFVTTDNSEVAFEVYNYTAGLLTAHSLKQQYPQIIIGQINANSEGFYVDFMHEPRIKESELVDIKNNVLKLISKNPQITFLCMEIEKALDYFKNNKYVSELLEIKAKTQDKKCFYQIGDQIYYRSGISTGAQKVKHFTILSIAGAYWLDDAKNEMLQRLYGVAHADKKVFDNILNELAERKERDHRKIGKDLDLFTFDPLVGAGLPIWLPNGTIVKRAIQDHVREKEWEYDFIEVQTPVIATSEMYKISGHWDHYKENMFPPMVNENEESVLRPMACPHHIAVYKSEQRSYRQLPLRIAEHAILHRFETSGSLTGLERVRMMELTDSHIFVRNDQIKEEFKRCYQLIIDTLKDFNIDIEYLSLSMRDPEDKEKYYPDDEMWNTAESMLKEALDELGLEYKEMIGEAAFYGPKLDFQIKTALNHDITMSTLQFDFLLPKKFDLYYIDQNNERQRPTMIHRGLIGTYERFIAILLEQTKGVLPFWLSPEQVRIIPLNLDKHLKYAEQIKESLKKAKIRASIDSRDERLSYKVREAQVQKIPYQIVIGDDELANNNISIRRYGSEDLEKITLEKFLELTQELIKNKK